MRYVLLVIDMLEDFFEGNATLAGQRAGLVAHINELTRAFREHGHAVVWVRQEFRPDLQDAFLEMRRRAIRINISGTPGADILKELERASADPVIVKKRYSAFFGTQLDALLRESDPFVLVVAGINTHACVRTTVIDAYQRDYDIVVATDCVGSYDREHHDVTVKYLDGKMARFLGNDAILALLSRPPLG
jgi:nicotinamidase-related amidase